MKILITNDDGVQAAQLPALIRWARKLGQVTVVVPKVEQSAKSHSIEIRKAFEARQILLEQELPVWTVDSSPADCVRFACSYLKEDYDLVISGINRGYNLGRDVMYSGTLAAASEAVNKGWKAIALSTSMKYYHRAAEHLDQIFAYLEENRLWEKNDLYNVNIPVDPQGIRITRMGGESYHEEFIPMEEDLYFPGGKPFHTESRDMTLDTVAAGMGYITVTPMTTDRTNLAVYAELTGK